MTDEDHDPEPVVPPAHDAEIGRVARSWAHLEFVIDQATWKFGAMEQQFGACVTAQIPSAFGKLSALMAILGLWGISDELSKEMRSFKGMIDGLMEQRNRIVHDPRMLDSQGQIVRWQITAKGGKQIFGPQPEAIGDLAKVRRDIRKAILRFNKLQLRIEAELLAVNAVPVRRFVIPREDPPGGGQSK